MTPSPRLPAVGLLLASLALAACGPRQDVRGPRALDGTAAVTPEAAASQSLDPATREASDASKLVAADMNQAAKNAAEPATNKVADAVMTTSINAELAKDPSLSALHIEVDTDAGRVVLRGSAPDEVTRERATQAAHRVQGVMSVDNQLTVSGHG